jgi:hypothetical protein
MAEAEVTLAAGIWREGTCVRHARVRAPAATEERALFDECEPLLPAERVTVLLARCAEVGGESGADAARSLTAGDRVALLLALRRLVCGDPMPCVLDCPWPDCGERLEIELNATELVAQGEAGGLPHELEFGGELLAFRLPTGADEEAAARTAVEAGLETAARELVRACLGDPPDEPAAGLEDALGRAIEQADPQVEITLALSCPACERESRVPLDVGSYLWRELEMRLARLDCEVHLLASHYGWSEAEILALGERRRARYIELVELVPA